VVGRYDATTKRPSFRYWYPNFTLKMKHVGPTLEIQPPANLGKAAFNGTTYYLNQIHFHAPPEHRMHDIWASLEVHFVHTSSAGGLLVLARQYIARDWDGYPQGDPGTPRTRLGFAAHFGAIVDNLDGLNQGQTKTVNFSFNPMELASSPRIPFFYYTGSKTTPPCNAGVTWIIDTSIGIVPAFQLQKYKTKFPVDNNRAFQPANGRTFPVCCDGLTLIPPDRALQGPF
jgi:carbonic anhydrase